MFIINKIKIKFRDNYNYLNYNNIIKYSKKFFINNNDNNNDNNSCNNKNNNKINSYNNQKINTIYSS